MINKPKRSLMLAAAVSSLALAGVYPMPATAQPRVELRFGPRIENAGVERMKFLASRLEEKAWSAVEEVSQVSRRDRDARRVSERIDRFARQVESFRVRLDRYDNAPWNVRRELRNLQRDAAWVTRSIERVGVDSYALDNWRAAERILARMDRIADGRSDREDAYSFWGR